MNKHRDLIQLLTANNSELVLEFFVMFSRFEYALKQAGFVQVDRYQNALPDWSSFAKKKGSSLFEDTMDREFIEAREFLLREPPRKQILRESDGTLQWQSNTRRHDEVNAVYLLRLVKDVRNNLFHGGKYPSGAAASEQALRNGRLLRACVIILKKSLSLDRDVQRFFETPYEV